jgi:hypothetical protein
MYTKTTMPDASMSTTASLQTLVQKSEQQELLFERNYPELYQWLQAESVLTSAPESVSETTVEVPNSNTSEQKLAVQISQEEFEAVVQKARDITQLPPGNIDHETELYLEQQLSDILGFTITAEISGNRLPHTHGIIQSLPHYKTSPTDTIENHSLAHASFSNKRSYFGWLNQGNPTKDSPTELESYSISLPLFLLPEWPEKNFTIKKWFAFRKVVLINPAEYRAVVCVISDAFNQLTAKYQYGGSPEVIMQTKCWSPSSMGKTLLFFVGDENDEIPLGPINIDNVGDVT